jgi:hypothetical protein
MNARNSVGKRHVLSILAASATLALGVLAVDLAPPAAARAVNAQQATSENWAGYVVRSNVGDQQFSSVSGSWIVPAASSNANTGQGQGYSAFWIGLGGSSNQSRALEQVGTSSDTVGGRTEYYAWYELVPAPETRLNLAIHPGDRIFARVNVSGSTVNVSLADQTSGQSVTKTLKMSNPDTSSAEWIAEAPSAESRGGSLQTLPLADFGTVTFTGASATSDGHTGPISDPNWSVQQVDLAPADAGGGWTGGGAGITGAGPGFVSAAASAGAQTSSLTGNGTSFSVSWRSDGTESGGGSATPAGGGSSSGGGSGGHYVFVTPGGGGVYVTRGGEVAFVAPGGGYAFVVPTPDVDGSGA